MAKAESVTMIERHVEKLVLVVCLLALALAGWHWLFSSPTKLAIVTPPAVRKAPVAPAEADSKLLAAARIVEAMYSGSGFDKTIPPVPAWVARLKDLRNMAPLATAQNGLAEPRIPLGPVEPPKSTTEKPTVEKLLAAMPAPAKPVVTSSIELPKRMPLADVVLARGLSGYPLAGLAAAWKKDVLRETVPFESVVPCKLIVEVQQAPADGDWSKAKTVLVQTASMDAAGKPIVLPEIPDFDGKNVAEVRKARDTVGSAAIGQQILQPIYLPVWRADLRQWVQPIIQQTLPGKLAPAAPAAPVAPAAAAAPAAPAAQPAQHGQAAIAFLDDSTMTVGPSYRYRVQLMVVNPLLTYDEAVDKDRLADARQKFLTSKPSEWSNPVSVRREVHFFITGANPLASKMTVTVYARKWGQWVAKTFDVQVGEFIGGVERVDLLDPMGKGKKSVDVDFSTGCVAVRLDFKKTMSRKGFNFTTVEMLYVNDEGRLQSRLKTWDDSSDRRKELLDAARKAATE